MVVGLAFLATAIATLFCEATAVRWSRRRKPHELAWAVSLAMSALASAALATGTSTGWDIGVFRAFYLLGAVLNVPWLALGTIYLLAGERTGHRARAVLVFLSGLAVGVVLVAPTNAPVAGAAIPVGREVFGAFPRILAAVGSGAGALVVFAGAAWSAWRFARGTVGGPEPRSKRSPRSALTNVLIAAGVLVTSGGGLIQGVVGHDEAFTASLAAGIVVIYAGFLIGSTTKK